MKQQAKTAGISQRQYAKQIGVHHSYVAKMIRKGAVSVLPDGSIDPVAADAARAKYTRVNRGKRRWQRRHPENPSPARVVVAQASNTAPVCEGCGGRYLRRYHNTAPSPARFCSASCEQDHSEGLSMAEIARQHDRAISPRKIKFAEPKPTPPLPAEPEPAPLLATCYGCGGLYNLHTARKEGGVRFDPAHHCSPNCQEMLEAGMRPAEIQRHIRTSYAEERCYTRNQLSSPNLFDWIKPDGSPNRVDEL